MESRSSSGASSESCRLRSISSVREVWDRLAAIPTETVVAGAAIAVFIQDVRVIDVGGGSVDLWLPAKLAPQVEWYADHGGIVLMTMQPGQVQSQVPAGGGS